MNPANFDPRRATAPSLPGPSTLPPPNKKKRPSQSTIPRTSVYETSPPPDGSGTPDLGKVRAYAACKSCRLKKVKCLPGPPNGAGLAGPPDSPGPCQQCTQGGLECTYPPTRDRAAYSRQYVQNLESRVHALEAVNARFIPMWEALERRGGDRKEILKVDSAAYDARPSSPLPSLSLRNEGLEPVPAAGEEDEEESNPDQDFGEDTGQMTQDEHGNYRWIGSSNTLSLLDSFAPSAPHHRPAPVAGQPAQPGSTPGNNPYFARVAGSGVIKALPTVDEVMYPEPAAAAGMIDAYFKEIHPILPIMIEQEFRDAYAALMERRARGVAETSGIFISVVFAMYALGERVLVTSAAWKRERQKAGKGSPMVEKREVDTGESVLPGEAEAGVIWYERAQILRYTTITDISLHQVQALLLMAAFQASVNAMPMSWLLCGIALRMAQDLGLHRSAARLKLSYAEKQVRSRCWWAAYGLDRMLSLTLGRPPGVEDLDIDVPYPAEVDDSLLPSFQSREHSASGSPVPPEPITSTMSGFVALTKLCKIAGKISHILYRPSHGRSINDPAWWTSQQHSISKLDRALRDWLEHEVPAKYKDQSQDQGIQLVSAALSNTYFACLITLHRNFLPPSIDSSRPRPPPSSTSLSHCVAAARSVIHIAAQSKVLLPPSHHLAVFCQYLWSAAVMLLLCEVQAKDQVVVDAVGPQVDSCRRSLQALEPVWPGARKLKELLDEAERRGKEVIASKGAERPTKKRRKSSQHDVAPKRPSSAIQRASTATSRPSPTRSNTPSAWAVPPSLRPPMTARPYETSDTRTTIPDTTFGVDKPYAPRPALAQHDSQLGSLTDVQANIPPVDYLHPGNLQPVNYTFDVGGVDFDGLEMLQGFNNDFASLWSTLIPDQPQYPVNSTPQLYQQAPPSIPGPNIGNGNGAGSNPTIAPSHPHTMASTPGSAGPSPHGSQWLQSPQVGYNAAQAQYGTLMDLGSSEFWSQVAAAGQDWGSDPNVPFNF